MKLTTRKLAALMLAVAMVVSLASVVQAEQPALGIQNALARGANLKMEMDVQLNNDVVQSLLGPFMSSDEGGTTTVLASILGAVNKLTTTVIYNKAAMSARIGTPLGDLVTLQGQMNTETMENSLATNLLPGTTITLDPAMMKQAMSSMPQNAAQGMTPEEVQAMIAPYSNAVTAFLNEKVMPAAPVEQGPFAVEGVATFESLATVTLTSHGAAGFLDAVLAVFKTDTKLQGLLSESLKTVQTAENATGTDAPAPADLPAMLKQMEDGIADIRSEADVTLGTVRYYSSPSDTMSPAYLEIESSDNSEEPMFATVMIHSQEKSSDIAIALLVKGREPSAVSTSEQTVSLSTKAPEGEATQAPTEAPASPEITDWAALHQAVLNGEDQTSMLMNLTIKSQTTDTSMDGSLAVDLRAPMSSMGSMYLGIALDTSSALGDKVDQQGTLTLSALTPAPVMTATFRLTETDEVPAAVPAGAQSIMLSETTAEATVQQMMGSLMSEGLPRMMENLKIALPEEAGIITIMIQQMMSQPTAQP